MIDMDTRATMKAGFAQERRDMSRVNRIVVSSAVLLVGSLCLAFLTKSQGPAVLKEVEPKQTPNAGEGVLSAGAWKSKLKIASPTQTLQGWAKEEDALERLQKKAEKRLKKDVKADDKAAGNDNNEDTANAEAATDAREGIPEDSIRAEAAAMGYSTVRAWREANEHPLDIPLHAKKKAPAKVAPAKPRKQQKLHRPENILGKLTHWVSAFFKADNEQQLYGGIPEEDMHKIRQIRQEADEDMRKIREQDTEEATRLNPKLDSAMTAHPVAGFRGAMAMSGITDDASSIPRLQISKSMVLREGSFLPQGQQEQEELGSSTAMLWKAEQLQSSSHGPVSDLGVER